VRRRLSLALYIIIILGGTLEFAPLAPLSARACKPLPKSILERATPPGGGSALHIIFGGIPCVRPSQNYIDA
jgi:hypothetical protein